MTGSISVARRWGRRAVALLGVASLVLTTLVASVAVDVARPRAAGAFPLGDGYWLVGTDGGIFSFGDAQFYGSTGSLRLKAPIVEVLEYPFLEGYWLIANDGGVFTFGTADFHGSTGSLVLNRPMVGGAATQSGLGYWMVASDGGVFAFGDARFRGSTGSLVLNAPIVDMAPTPTGNGYWLVGADGGIFSFGDARFHGSTGSLRLNAPIVNMAETPSGNGYWLTASDGGIFAFGDAKFHGSTGSLRLNQPVVGMDRTRSGNGYRLVASDGGIFSFGDARFFGSTGSLRLNAPIVGMATRPPFAVKVDAYADTAGQSSDWVQNAGGDWQLQLTRTSTTGNPAGAIVLGVEGLTVDQLGTIGFTVDSGTCDASDPHFALFMLDPTTRTAQTRVYPCAAGGGPGPGQKSFNPLAPPGQAAVGRGWVVDSLDIVMGDLGTTTLDDIRVAGFTVTDFRTLFRESGPQPT